MLITGHIQLCLEDMSRHGTVIVYLQHDKNIPSICIESVLLYWSLVQYNNVQEEDRIAREGAMLPDGYIAMLPDGYITSVLCRLVIAIGAFHLGDLLSRRNTAGWRGRLAKWADRAENRRAENRLHSSMPQSKFISNFSEYFGRIQSFLVL